MSCSSTAAATTTTCCYNPDCRESKFECLKKGWRLRTGDFAQLCDRCSSAYQDDRFCELFHTKAAGWRSCESCRRPLHCGCIVSIQTYILMDVGGVECITCARKHSILASNQSWSHLPLPLSERFKDSSITSWSPMAAPNGVNGQWWHSANARSALTSQSELYSRMPYEVDRSNGVDKLTSADRPSLSGLDLLEEPLERAVPNSLSLSVLERFSNSNVCADMVVALKALNGSVNARKGVIVEPGGNTSVAGMSFDRPSNIHADAPLQPLSAKDQLIPQHRILKSYASSKETNSSTGIPGSQQQQSPPPPLTKQSHVDSQNVVDTPPETQLGNGKTRVDSRGRNNVLPRYWPQITDQELQQISGDSNLVATPLFEKILSASDAGRIGRLVLPKKCAEAYFPRISSPEGVPLRVQDCKGMEWVFQFRFWPNNNSRMYVLEGVTPCIQNMNLQAGDTVTFSRLDPDGKLVMGFRKTSIAPSSNQDNRKPKTGNGVPKNAGAIDTNTWSEVDKLGYIAKDALKAKSSCLTPSKRKNSVLALKNKRLQIDNEDLIELQITWEEAQGLLRPPPNYIPFSMDVDGQQFEEYEEAPIFGKPNILGIDSFGENVQWAQCEECSKWRKLPVDALLPSKWTCSDNLWDPKRSSCSSDQEITDGQLQDMIHTRKSVASNVETKSVKRVLDLVEGSEGLDTLANLAILAEVEATPSVQATTTKHPRHRPGCTCIVCIQPPSGKGPKHSDTCICNVCLTVRRRFRTLMERRAKRPPECESGNIKKKQTKLGKPESTDDILTSTSANGKLDKELAVFGHAIDDYNLTNPSSPFKGGIDLNMRPEKEDESSPRSGSLARFHRDSSELQLKQQKLPSSSKHRGMNQLDTSGSGTQAKADNPANGVSPSSDHEDVDMDHPVPLCVWLPTASETG